MIAVMIHLPFRVPSQFPASCYLYLSAIPSQFPVIRGIGLLLLARNINFCDIRKLNLSLS